MANDLKNVRLALAKALADHRVEDAAIEAAAKHLVALPQPIRGIDVCAYGICIDVFLDGKDWQESLQKLLGSGGQAWRKLEVFPYGIPYPDIIHVQLGQPFEGIPRGPRFG
jgi:hypothetical protein